MIRKIFIISLFICFSAYVSKAQDVIDKIVAVVGDEIILLSDIEAQYFQMMAQNYIDDTRDVKCDILEEMLFQKLLLNQALLDSIEITNKEVDTEIDRRLGHFISQYGSERQLEEVYGKSVTEIKADFRTIIKDQLLTQKMQMQLVGDIAITPAEVREFYNSFPKDSLPVIDAYYEFSEIVILPEIGEEEKNETIETLNNIRQRVNDGESFQTLAVLYSEDQGSAMNGGELGFMSREDLVPEFAAVAFNLSAPGDVSRVVKTDFGYHLIQLIEKRGTMANVRHILMSPKISDEQLSNAENKINEIYEFINKDSISFVDAVKKYSQADSKHNNGAVTNPYTGNRKINKQILDNNTNRIVSRLNADELSEPFLGVNAKNKKVFKIIKLDKKVEEHVANLEDDYREIQEFALQKAQQDFIYEWINEALNKFYINIDDSYANCNYNYVDWNKASKKNNE